MAKPSKIAFVDTETTGTQDYHEAWEVAAVICPLSEYGIVEEPEDKVTFFVDPANFSQADPFALRVGRFNERFKVPFKEDTAYDVLSLWKALDNVVFAGFVPSFDERFVSRLFLRHGLPPYPWHHRLFDVGTYAQGYAHASGSLGSPPVAPGTLSPSSQDVLDLYEVKVAEGQRHTAMGDALAAFEVMRNVQSS